VFRFETCLTQKCLESKHVYLTKCLESECVLLGSV